MVAQTGLGTYEDGGATSLESESRLRSWKNSFWVCGRLRVEKEHTIAGRKREKGSLRGGYEAHVNEKGLTNAAKHETDVDRGAMRRGALQVSKVS